MHNQYRVPAGRIITLVLAWAGGLLALSSIIFYRLAPLRPRTVFDFTRDSGLAHFVGALDNFDAGSYFDIARAGYPAARLGLRAFFPLYPGIMHIVVAALSPLLHPDVAFALGAIVVNIAALCGVAVLLWRLTVLERGTKHAYWALGFLLAFPGSYILLAPYTEALFLLATIGAFYAARTKRWWLAGVLGMVAGFTRLPGIILLVALLVEYLEQCDWQFKNIRWNVGWLGLIVVGITTYFGWLQLAAGGISTYVAGYHASWPDRHATWNVLAVALHPVTAVLHHERPKPNDLLGLIGIGLGVSFLAVFRRYRLRWSYATLVLLGLLVPLASGNLESILRYSLVMFPLAILFEALAGKRPRLAVLWLIGSSAANIALMYLFVRGVFVG